MRDIFNSLSRHFRQIVFGLMVATGLLGASANAGSDYGDFGESVPENAAFMVVAGGCFWCIEKDFEKLESVYEVVSGYAGGASKNPTYYSHSGHREVVKIYYNPEAVSYAELIDYYYRHVDYEDNGGQFCDRGHAYTPVIHVKNEEQRQIAQQRAPAGSVVPIEDEVMFWQAEQYHQDYYMKNPLRYKYYRYSCGRDRRVAELNLQNG